MADTAPVRPTRRALSDLRLDIPTIAVPLSELEHPVVVRVQAIPDMVAANSAERVLSLKDRVWFKVKTGAWRGAAGNVRGAVDDSPRAALETGQAWWWLAAAGARQNDSPQRDFYSRLDAEAHAAGPNSCSTDFLLPQAWDIKRLEAELALALVNAVPPLVRRAAALSMQEGDIRGFTYGPTDVRVRIRMLNDGQVYLAISSVGATDPDFFALLLSAFDGLTVHDWLPEPGPYLQVQPEPGEILWSTILTPEAQQSLLHEVDVEASGNEAQT
ncbi:MULTISPECIES: hypothetical protein [unclassified Leifsonia]|uniref:hypothetical protein n=1 Tax=unclassified Leifsonia TaxID=2663824 RepID=UPI0008A76B1A|nr:MULTISPECIES: hypothetical protein [unclassified Leifsonia]SEI02724.1 hypothetical protein SAMN04515694_11092 [Leifsonia sp. CL154]SFL71689.1 hypothetical protein SAMN04515692_11092 [Leifsonia sp. CL147]